MSSSPQDEGEFEDPVGPTEPESGPFLTVRHEWGDLLVGSALLATAAWFYITGSQLDDYSGPGIGAADFPQGLAALLGLGVLVILVGATRRLASNKNPRFIVVRRYGHVGIGMALLVAFPALMKAVGYYPAMTAWLAAFLVLAGIRHPLHVVGYVAGFLVFTKVVFEMILGTPFS
jgi:hypothetical protein